MEHMLCQPRTTEFSCQYRVYEVSNSRKKVHPHYSVLVVEYVFGQSYQITRHIIGKENKIKGSNDLTELAKEERSIVKLVKSFF